MAHHDRTYMLMLASEVNLIDFNEIVETSADKMRYTIEGKITPAQVVFKYEHTPTFIDNLSWTEGPYSYADILTIMTRPEWISDDILGIE